MRPSNIGGNLILSSLEASDYALLEPHLVPVLLHSRQSLESANRPVQSICFPYRGIISVVASTRDKRHEAEVGIIGWKRMTGLSVVLGTERSPTNTFVQMAGDGQSIKAEILKQLVEDRTSLRNVFLRFVHVFAVQAEYTALANAHGTLDQRLARWLLMAHDRTLGDELHLTHDFATMAQRRL